MTAIQTDAANDVNTTELSEDAAGEEFLRRFLGPDEGSDASKKKKPSAENTDEDQDEPDDAETDKKSKDPAEKPETKDDETDEEETDNEGDEDSDDDDEVLFKIKVDGEEKEVPASALKRLYGQEAALTKKSMEVAEQRKTAEAEIQRAAAATAALLERARERAKPFQGIDFNLAAQKLTEEEYTALRKQAQVASEEVQFLEHHTAGFMQAIKEKQQQELRTKAVETIKLLSGPADKGGIEGWSDKLYNEIRDYAKGHGAPADVINNIVDPWAIRMMHAAMLYERGKSKSNVTIKRVNKTPKKVVKTTNSPAARKGDDQQANTNKLMKKLQASGSTDDAAELFMARWKKPSDD